MFGKPLKLFTYKGVPVEITWLAILLMLFLMLPAVPLLSFSSGGILHFVIVALIPIGLFLSIFVHELAHAVVGTRLGATVTLLQLNILGGVTHFAPRPPAYFKDLFISMAGPVSNLLLWKLCDWLSVSLSSQISNLPLFNLSMVLSSLATLNLLLAVFNALPIYPLDGGQATYALVMAITYRQKFAASVTVVLSGLILIYLMFVPNSLIIRDDPILLIFMLWVILWVALSCNALYQHAVSIANFYPSPEAQFTYTVQQNQKWPDKSKAAQLFAHGQAQWAAQQYVAALGTFTQAHELEPKEPKYLAQRAAAYLQIEEFGAALTDYNLLLQKAPAQAELYAGRATALAGTGNINAARADLAHALHLNPLEVRALLLERDLEKVTV